MYIQNFFKYSILLFALLNSNIVTSNDDIYYIDMEFLMNNSLAGKSIIKKLDEQNKSSQKKFQEIEENLKIEENRIISKKNILSEQEYFKEVELFKKKIENYKLSRNKTINDISIMKNNSQKKLIELLRPILAEYSEKNSISYIIPKQNIIIGKTELDLTKTILEILNSKIKNIKFE
ncbi:OmpH family outer membrane protein [Candidatus Pelagibacter sp.]|nr:OmpH family outer membrane protein [Candidatus Pelagibacter sp.]